MLNFLGRGGAFNTKEGNTSAFIKENGKLLLIDCGESVFERLMRDGVLDDVSNISVLLTHTHSDHIGSMGSLVMYSYFIKKQPLNILMSSVVKHVPNIKKILDGFGCIPSMVNYIDVQKLDNQFESFDSVRYVPTSHCDELDSYGIMFQTKNGIVYYSGDTKELTQIKEIIDSQIPIDKIYVEASNVEYPDTVHLSLRQLDKGIPQELRDRVYCMHFNNDDCIIQAQELGFQIVKTLRQEFFVDFENYSSEKETRDTEAVKEFTKTDLFKYIKDMK